MLHAVDCSKCRDNDDYPFPVFTFTSKRSDLFCVSSVLDFTSTTLLTTKNMIRQSATPLHNRTYKINDLVKIKRDSNIDDSNIYTIIAIANNDVNFSDAIRDDCFKETIKSTISAKSLRYAVVKTCDLKNQTHTPEYCFEKDLSYYT